MELGLRAGKENCRDIVKPAGTSDLPRRVLLTRDGSYGGLGFWQFRCTRP